MMEERIPDVPPPAAALDLAAEILAGIWEDFAHAADYISAYLAESQDRGELHLAALIGARRKGAAAPGCGALGPCTCERQGYGMTKTAPRQAAPVHLITIDMGAWCGASWPDNARASSAWPEVTCRDCRLKQADALKALVWDMLQTMGPSRQALDFAVRAGRLGVRDEQGRSLANGGMRSCG